MSNRRQFISSLAVATGGVGLQSALDPKRASAQVASVRDADVCVVGAGYAGLTAALRLQQAGRSVVLLEARNRIGGRIWSEPLSDGTPIDIGGHWVGPTQRRILALAQEMNVPIFESFTAGDVLYMGHDGSVTKELPAAVSSELEPALKKLDSLASTVPLEAPWLASQAAEWDMQTIGTWLADNVKNSAARDLLAVEMMGSIGPVAPEQSLLWVLFAFHAAGGLKTLLKDEGALAIHGGAQAVALRVAAALGDSIHLNCPVRRIVQNAHGVEVTSDAIVVRARRVIVAIPRTLAGYIDFDPILPADSAQLLQRMPMGSVIKATLVYDEAFWRHAGLSGGSLNVASPVSATLDGGLAPGQDRPGLLIAFIGGGSARKLGHLSAEQRQQIVVGEIVKLYGPAAGKLSQHVVYPATGLSYIDHNWSEEEWTRGDYAAFLPPGVLTGFGQAIREPIGRIHWAGTETATEWNVYMDGAVQSGERAAAEALSAD